MPLQLSTNRFLPKNSEQDLTGFISKQTLPSNTGKTFVDK